MRVVEAVVVVRVVVDVVVRVAVVVLRVREGAARVEEEAVGVLPMRRGGGFGLLMTVALGIE